MASFVMRLNTQEWPLVVAGLLCSIIAGFEGPASAILYGYAVTALSKSSDVANGGDSNGVRSGTAFWAWMFFLLAVIMTLVFVIQGSVSPRARNGWFVAHEGPR